jgi:hypothetical protein
LTQLEADSRLPVRRIGESYWREREDGGRDKRGDRGGVEGVLGEDLLLHVICLRNREGGRDSEIRERAGEGGRES